MTTFPTLYKRSSAGALQQWDIFVEDSTIVTRWGQVGGAIQEARDTVANGKNLGKKNATTAEEQARSEAKSKWTKQIERKGYVEDRKRAERGERDQTYIPPMLAPTTGYKANKKKIHFPAAVQPKLDGIRCEARIDDGEVTLWSRTGKPITAVPHVIRELKEMFPTGQYVLDGELYNHEYHDEFEEICSIVRDQTEVDKDEIMQYHSYDIMDDEMPQEARLAMLVCLFQGKDDNGKHIVRVPHVIVNSEEELWVAYEQAVEKNYEGAMARNLDAFYEPGKRSANLQKIKEFDETEFEVAAVFDGRGKMKGKAIFGCKIDASKPTVYKDDGSFDQDDPNQFNVKMKGKLSVLADYLKNPKKALGKKLTTKHFGWTKYNKPRFPVGKAIRDYE